MLCHAKRHSHSINPEVKRALTAYSKQHGLKIRFVVEQAIAELIEDESDLAVGDNGGTSRRCRGRKF